MSDQKEKIVLHIDTGNNSNINNGYNSFYNTTKDKEYSAFLQNEAQQKEKMIILEEKREIKPKKPIQQVDFHSSVNEFGEAFTQYKKENIIRINKEVEAYQKYKNDPARTLDQPYEHNI